MKNIYKLFIWAGILCLLAAAGLASYNLRDSRRAEKAAADVVTQIQDAAKITTEEKETGNGSADSGKTEYEKEAETPLYRLNPQISMPTTEIDGRLYIGILYIPALSLTLPVMKDWSYSNLKIAPCCYSGSAYLDNFVIAGHNYRGHFRTLKNLRQGDEVIFTDVDGNVFRYVMREMEILEATDASEMITGDWSLTLFTCTVGGKKRVTIRCDVATEEDS